MSHNDLEAIRSLLAKVDSDLEAIRSILAKVDKQTNKHIPSELVEESQQKPIKKKYTDFPQHIGTILEGATRDENVVSYDKYKNDSLLERIIDESELLPAYFLEEGALVLKPVARVNIHGSFGTGFLISPSIFMTNNHVLPTPEEAQRAKFEFSYQLDYQGNPQPIDTYTANPSNLFYTSPQEKLDFTIVRLNDKHLPVQPSMLSPERFSEGERSHRSGLAKSEVTERLTSAGERWGYFRLRIRQIAERQMCNIIQHPDARYKEVSLQDNRLERILANAIRYRTDTEPGSSGSPVFDNEWELIALHHAGGDFDPQQKKWLNNEGIRLDMIIQDIKNHFQNTTEGQAVLIELGIQN